MDRTPYGRKSFNYDVRIGRMRKMPPVYSAYYHQPNESHSHAQNLHQIQTNATHPHTHTHTQWITGKGNGIAKDIPKTLFICSQIPMRGTGLYAVAINMLVYEAMLMI